MADRNPKYPSDDIAGAIPVPPHVPQPGTTTFYVPPTLQSDFENWLHTDVPNVNYTFMLRKDWYHLDAEGAEPEYIRASYFPIQWKSKIGNSDANSNFKTHHWADIRKGDLVVREDGAVMMLNWKVQVNPNNRSTQAIDCNSYITFTRWMEEKLDERGYLLEEAHGEVIAPSIPCVYAEYAGRPDYAPNFNAPGIAADHLLTVQVQFNSRTKDILISDEFILWNQKYRIVNQNFAEVDIDGQYGIINLMARRMAGESPGA